MPKMVSFTEPRQASERKVILEGLKNGRSETIIERCMKQQQVKAIDISIQTFI